jgi:hypothetical protein
MPINSPILSDMAHVKAAIDLYRRQDHDLTTAVALVRVRHSIEAHLADAGTRPPEAVIPPTVDEVIAATGYNEVRCRSIVADEQRKAAAHEPPYQLVEPPTEQVTQAQAAEAKVAADKAAADKLAADEAAVAADKARAQATVKK